VSHANAALTPRARLRLAQLVVDRNWAYSSAAAMFMVSPRTARKWADRYRAEGPAGMADRSSRPHISPARTPPQAVRQIVRLRLGPVQIGCQLGRGFGWCGLHSRCSSCAKPTSLYARTAASRC
jgi:transposase-like protein